MNSTKYRAMICDDNQQRIAEWTSQVRKHLGDDWEVESVTEKRLAAMVTALSEHEQRVRKGDHARTASEGEALSGLDDAQLVILDSDLSPNEHEFDSLDPGDAKDVVATLRNQYGDQIARQIRSYTTAGFIVVANMFTTQQDDFVFDLTMVQDAGTFADLHIKEAELDDESLWADVPRSQDRFNPWSRPLLGKDFESVLRSEIAITDIHAKVLETLGLNADEFGTQQLDVFGAVDPTDATFEDLAYSDLGFKYKDPIGHDLESVKRMAASVVRRWLARAVIISQDVLCDAPHLVSRFPEYLGEGAADIAVWNAAADKGAADPLPLAAIHEATEVAPFIHRPVFFADRARRGLNDLPQRDTPHLRAVFAEDAAVFLSRTDAKEFESNVPGPYARRYVVPIDDVAYDPFTRLLLR